MEKKSKDFLEEGKKKLQNRKALVMGKTLWDSIKPHDLGFEDEALLAGPDFLVFKGPGGFWRISLDNLTSIEPITDEKVEELKESYS